MRAPMRWAAMQLLQPGFPDADQRELGGHKEGVCCDEQNDCRDPQHNESNHEAEILPSERRARLARACAG